MDFALTMISMGDAHQIQTLELIFGTGLHSRIQLGVERTQAPLQILNSPKRNLSPLEITIRIPGQNPLHGGHHEDEDHGIAKPGMRIKFEQRNSNQEGADEHEA